ncbi:hypothetical protein ACFLY6_03185 [Candidatus Dependentiae bacterium]
MHINVNLCAMAVGNLFAPHHFEKPDLFHASLPKDFCPEVFDTSSLSTPIFIEAMLRGETNPALIKDANGKRFIIKQDNSARGQKHHMNEWFAPISEILGSTIARSVNVKANYVRLIKPKVRVRGKPSCDRAATVHDYIPAVTLKHRGFPVMGLKWSNSLRENLEFFSKFQGLPKLFAVDTFICNPDRHPGNILYDIWTNSICGVDFGRAFYSGNVAEKMIEYFETADFKTLETRHWKALLEYRDALKELVELWPVERIYSLFWKSVEMSELFTCRPIKSEFFWHEAQTRLKLVEENYNSVRGLLEYLETSF